MGGACLAGQCQPVQVWNGNNGADFTLGSNRVYLSSGPTATTIQYVPTDAASNATPVEFAVLSDDCRFPAVDSVTSNIYLSCDSGFRWVSAPAGGQGTSFVPFSVSLVDFQPIYAQADTAVWVSYYISGFGTIRTAKNDGTLLRDLVNYGNSPRLTILATDNTSVFVKVASAAEGSAIYQIDLSNGVSVPLYAPSLVFSPVSAASDGSTVFFTVAGQGLFSVPKGATSVAPSRLPVDALVDVVAAVDDTSIYYGVGVDAITAPSQCSSYRVARIPKAGGAEEILASGSNACFNVTNNFTYKMLVDSKVVVYQPLLTTAECAATTCLPVFKVAK
jgi:hypothetical protein